MAREYTNELQIDFGPDGNKLIPVVTQDLNSRNVLIFSYTNNEAFEETVRSGYATYFSRSRNEIWKKGASSGDLLKVAEIRINCEQNSLLYLVIPQGRGACHALKDNGMPHATCYYRRVLPDGKLEMVEE